MPAIWNSYSKSDTALRPRTMTLAPASSTNRVRRVSKGRTSMREPSPQVMAATSSATMDTRSSSANRGSLPVFTATATIRSVDHPGRPLDDVHVTEGQGVEGARIDADAGNAHGVSPTAAAPAPSWTSSSASSSSTSRMRVTETMRASSATRNRVTPRVRRPMTLMVAHRTANELPAVGDHDDLVAVEHGEGGHHADRSAAALQVERVDALAAAAGDPVFVGGGPLAEAVLGQG